MYGEDNMLIRRVLSRMNEREKELNCIYGIEELLRMPEISREELFRGILDLIPSGWQYPLVCEARLSLDDKIYSRQEFRETEWSQSADIIVDGKVLGKIEVFYLQFIRNHKGSQFLPEEQKLLNTIAERLSDYIFFHRLKNTIELLHTTGEAQVVARDSTEILSVESDEHWRWRLKMAEIMAEKMNFEKYGVQAVYLLGSVKNACAGPGSDIDLMVHINAEQPLRDELKAWIDGWGLCLAEMNFSKSGYPSTHSLVDVHFITDEDIAAKNSYAVKIGHHSDGARLLRTK